MLAISEPRNNFPLRRDATRTLLIAGGIGITPLLSMAQALDNSSLPYELHYFARAERQLAFPRASSKRCTDKWSSSSRPDARGDGRAPSPTLAVVLWPSTSMSAAPARCSKPRATAAARAGPKRRSISSISRTTRVIDDSLELRRRARPLRLTLDVPAGKTILEVLREAGINVPSSCEQGACGTCLTTVLEGEPDHQDVYLNDTEKRPARMIMTCVSAPSRRGWCSISRSWR